MYNLCDIFNVYYQLDNLLQGDRELQAATLSTLLKQCLRQIEGLGLRSMSLSLAGGIVKTAHVAAADQSDDSGSCHGSFLACVS